MIRRSDTTVSDALDTPLSGVYVTVRDANGDLATIYSDDGVTLKGNPFQTAGVFEYWADEGAYTEEYRLTLAGQPRQVVGVTLEERAAAEASANAAQVAAATAAANALATGLDRIATETAAAAATDAEALLTAASEALATGTVSDLVGTRIYTSRSSLNADLAPTDGLYALVVGDATAANNDLYRKSGATGTGSWVGPLGLFAAASALASNYAAAAAASAALLNDTEFPTYATEGHWSGTATLAALGSTAGTFAVGQPFRQRAKLRGGKINVGASGNLVICRVKNTGDANKFVRVGGYVTLPVTAGTGFTFDDAAIAAANGGNPLIFEPGEMCAFWASTCTVKFDVGPQPYRKWNAGSATVMSTSTGHATTLAFNNIQIDPNTSTFGAPSEDAVAIDLEFYFGLARPVAPAQIAELEKVDSFSAVPGDWRNDAGFSVSGGAIQLTGLGFSNQLLVNKPYGLTRRTQRTKFKITSSNAVMAFVTDPIRPHDSRQFEGSMISVDVPNATLRIHGRWNGDRNVQPAVLDTLPLVDPAGNAITLAAGITYVLDWTKLDNDMLVSLASTQGAERFDTVVTNTPNVRNTTYGNTTKYGLMHGSPGWAMLAGTAEIQAWHHWANVNQFCSLGVRGDSKAEGYNVPNPELYTWGALWRAILGEDNVFIDACGGRDAVGGVLASYHAAWGLRPSVEAFELGTNPEAMRTFAESLAAAARISQGVGATSLLAVPALSTNQVSVATVAAAVGATLLKFNLATTLSGDSSSRIPAYYDIPDDPTHEVVLGQQAKWSRSDLDAGSIIRAARV